jgi:signal transduction histidine kinase
MIYKTALSFIRKTAAALTLAFLVFFPFIAGAQNFDSLYTVLHAHPGNDTTRVNVLWKLAQSYENNSTDSMIKLANEGLAAAKVIGYEKGEALCNQSLGLAYLHLSEYERSLEYYTRSRLLFEKEGNKRKLINIYLSMGDVYIGQSNQGEAIAYYNKGIKLCNELNNNIGSGFALISIGGIYHDVGNYTDAINNYLKALTAFEKDNYTPGISMAYSDIADLYAVMNDFGKAIDYIHKSEAIDTRKNSKEQNLLNITNAGDVYRLTKDYPRSLAYFRKGLLIADSMGYMVWQNQFLINIAHVYYGMEQYDSALTMYIYVLKQTAKAPYTLTIVDANIGIGKALTHKGQVKEGIAYFLKALGVAQQNHMKQAISETAKYLEDCYEQLHDDKDALKYNKLYFDYKDSVYNDKSSLEIQQLQFDYELGKKENEIALLNKDKAIELSSLRTEQVVVWALVTGLGLLGFISVLLYRNNQNEKKSKAAIVRQKEEIQVQSARLEELNNFKDKTFSVLSHDLRGPVTAITAAMSLLDEQLISPEDFAAMRPDVTKQLVTLNILLDNLLNWAKGYMQGIAARPERTDLNQITDLNIYLAKDIADAKKITISNNLPSEAFAFCDPAQIDIVMRNIINNSVKFTNTGGTIDINASVENNRILLSITDSGVGMTPDQLHKLFTPAVDNNTYGTDGERGTGLGLLLCYEFVKANNGTITVTSEPGKGSRFVVALPVG